VPRADRNRTPSRAAVTRNREGSGAAREGIAGVGGHASRSCRPSASSQASAKILERWSRPAPSRLKMIAVVSPDVDIDDDVDVIGVSSRASIRRVISCSRRADAGRSRCTRE
jgi:hypothetical protein